MEWLFEWLTIGGLSSEEYGLMKSCGDRVLCPDQKKR